MRPANAVEGAPALVVDGTSFYFVLTGRGEEIHSADDTIIITPDLGTNRVVCSYRARFASPTIPGFLMDIYSKRTGNVRRFNFPTSAARVALRMLAQQKKPGAE